MDIDEDSNTLKEALVERSVQNMISKPSQELVSMLEKILAKDPAFLKQANDLKAKHPD